MSGLQGKHWYFFIWDEDNEEHLGQHRIDGKTDSGRRLRLIIEDMSAPVARVITGWDL